MLHNYLCPLDLFLCLSTTNDRSSLMQIQIRGNIISLDHFSWLLFYIANGLDTIERNVVIIIEMGNV